VIWAISVGVQVPEGDALPHFLKKEFHKRAEFSAFVRSGVSYFRCEAEGTAGLLSAEVELLTFAIADDLTGALEIGAKFAAHGFRSVVRTSVHAGPALDASVVVIDTETRHVAAAEAASRTKEMAEFARRRSAYLIYKKTDSTLRGNIGAELRALQEIFPMQRLIYAPAYPELGRTVKTGQLFVHGIPVHLTEFANDPWSPVRDSRVRSVVGDVPVVVMDGECEGDIDAAANLILAEPPPRICAGPAALAEALTRKIGTGLPEAIQFPRVARCLVVNGSLHPVSTAQIMTAARQQFFSKGWVLLEEAVEGSGSERAARVGGCVRRILSDEAFDALIVFGGETAFGIHQALSSLPFEAIGELEPGVAVSKSGDLLWITKAGGFGAPDILFTIRKRLT
jgi:uncharacterized protein YgbK (DUF1537 family)